MASTPLRPTALTNLALGQQDDELHTFSSAFGLVVGEIRLKSATGREAPPRSLSTMHGSSRDLERSVGTGCSI